MLYNQVANDRIKQVITSAGEEDFPEVLSETVPIETVLLSKFYDCPGSFVVSFNCIWPIFLLELPIGICRLVTIVCKVPVLMENLYSFAASPTKLLPSWFLFFNKELVRTVSFSEHEAFDHPVACKISALLPVRCPPFLSHI